MCAELRNDHIAISLHFSDFWKLIHTVIEKV